jgi:hypothetical protein
MKIRTGFVSNSSSSSFVANLDRLSKEQLDIILNYHLDHDPTHHCQWGMDSWDFTVDNGRGLIEGYTIMDNGDLKFYLEFHRMEGLFKLDDECGYR